PVREATDDGRLARLVAPGDDAGLAAALAAALADGRRPDGEAARWVREHFDSDAVGPAVEAYLTEVADLGRPRRSRRTGGRRATRARRAEPPGPLRTGTLVVSIDTELQWGA